MDRDPGLFSSATNLSFTRFTKDGPEGWLLTWFVTCQAIFLPKETRTIRENYQRHTLVEQSMAISSTVDYIYTSIPNFRLCYIFARKREMLITLRPKGCYIWVIGNHGRNVFITAFEKPALYNAELHPYCIQVEKCIYYSVSLISNYALKHTKGSAMSKPPLL